MGMRDLVIGVIVLLVGIGMGVYNVANPEKTFDTKYFAQMGIALLGGSYLIYGSRKSIADLLSKFKSDKKEEDPEPEPEPEKEEEMIHDTDAEPEIEEEKMLDLTLEGMTGTENNDVLDFICMNYLQSRFSDMKSQEALDKVVELNTLLFKAKSAQETRPNEPEGAK